MQILKLLSAKTWNWIWLASRFKLANQIFTFLHSKVQNKFGCSQPIRLQKFLYVYYYADYKNSNHKKMETFSMQVKASFVDKICRSRTVEINEDQQLFRHFIKLHFDEFQSFIITTKMFWVSVKFWIWIWKVAFLKTIICWLFF